jgi:putative hydrolase of the HAD superfamily
MNACIFCEDLGPNGYKPSSAPYQIFMQKFEHLKLSGDRFIYIGDHPEKDFIGARALGWQTIRVRRSDGLHAHLKGRQGVDADSVIESLCELL